IMDQGQIIKEGTVDELVRSVQHEERVTIEVTEPELVPLTRIEKVAGVRKVEAAGGKITVISSAGSGSLDRIVSIVKEHTGLIGIYAEKPNLEDVFLTLTGKQLRDEGGQ